MDEAALRRRHEQLHVPFRRERRRTATHVVGPVARGEGGKLFGVRAALDGVLVAEIVADGLTAHEANTGSDDLQICGSQV